MTMRYQITIISRKLLEPEDYWTITERGYEMPVVDVNQNGVLADINGAYLQLNTLIQERQKDFPLSDYVWIVEEAPQDDRQNKKPAFTIDEQHRINKWKDAYFGKTATGKELESLFTQLNQYNSILAKSMGKKSK